MSDLIEPAVPTVAFERHPAAIERHTGERAVRPLPPGHPAATEVTTWFPVYSFELPESDTPPPGEAPYDDVSRDTAGFGPTALGEEKPPPLPTPDSNEPEPVARLEEDGAAAAMWSTVAEVTRPVPVEAALVFDTRGFEEPVPELREPDEHGLTAPVFETHGLELPEVGVPGAVLPLGAGPEEVVEWLEDRIAPPVVPAGRPERDLLWPGTPPRYPIAESAPLGDGFWTSDPDGETLLRQESRPSRLRPLLAQAALAVGALAVLVVLGVAAVRLLPTLFGSGQTETAVFNAPMMVVRSAVTGRVMTVAANAGQVVDPQSRLLTIQGADSGGPERVVLAGVHGVIRSVETVPGADLATGAPLVRMQDCDRAFLTIPPGTKFRAGEAVLVKLPDLPPVTGAVRAASGIMEPPNMLVVGLRPGSMGAACPVGVSAVVTPVVQG